MSVGNRLSPRLITTGLKQSSCTLSNWMGIEKILALNVSEAEESAISSGRLNGY